MEIPGREILFFVLGALSFLLVYIIVNNRTRQEPNFKIYRGRVIVVGVFAFIVGFVVFGNYGAAILAATIISSVVLGANYWYEATLHADCSTHSHTGSDQSVSTSRGLKRFASDLIPDPSAQASRDTVKTADEARMHHHSDQWR